MVITHMATHGGCFPRRAVVGYTFSDSNQYPGSRGILTKCSTAYTNPGTSIYNI